MSSAISVLKRMRREVERFYTLTEISLFIIAVSVSIIVVNKIGPEIISSSVAKKEVDEIHQATDKVSRIFAGKTYNGLSTGRLIDFHAFPEDRLVAGILINRWGGVIHASPSTGYKFYDTARLSYTNVPSVECVKIAKNASDYLVRIAVDGINVKPYGGALNINLLENMCNQGPLVTMDYYFK